MLNWFKRLFDFRRLPDDHLPHVQAWRHAPMGHSVFRGYETIRDDRMLIMVKPMPGHQVEGFRIVAFPHPSDRRYFNAFRYALEVRGPSERNPSGIGTVELRDWGLLFSPSSENLRALDPKKVGKIDWFKSQFFIHLAQAHFFSEKDHPNGLPLAVLKRNAGWRKRCFRVALQKAGDTGRNLVLEKKGFVRSDMIHELIKVAREANADCLDANDFLIISPHSS